MTRSPRRDRARRGAGNGQLHVAGAGARADRRRALGHFQRRRRALRDAHRRAAVPGRLVRRDDERDPETGRAGSSRVERRAAAGPRPHRPALPREESRRAVSVGAGSRVRAAIVVVGRLDGLRGEGRPRGLHVRRPAAPAPRAGRLGDGDSLLPVHNWSGALHLSAAHGGRAGPCAWQSPFPRPPRFAGRLDPSGPNPLALSPDGRYLAFVASVGTTSFLWLRPLDSQTANRLAGTEGAVGPFWSPDSQSIAFFAGGRLKRVGVAGGEPQTLAETNGLGGATWSPDGVILLSPDFGGRKPARPCSCRRGADQPGHPVRPRAWRNQSRLAGTSCPTAATSSSTSWAATTLASMSGRSTRPMRTQLLAFDLTDPNDVGLSTLAYAAPGTCCMCAARP